MRNKKGEEMVEAAIVLPVLILTILSLILLILYYFSALTNQLDLHGRLLAEAEESGASLKRISEETDSHAQMRGLADILMKKEIGAKIYVLSPADLIRTGELIGID